VFVRDAEPGDVLEIRILDVRPRPAALEQFTGRAFGSNAAAWWGFHYSDLLTEPKPREVITIYEIDAAGDRNWARAVYSYRWTPQTDPSGVVHPTIERGQHRSVPRQVQRGRCTPVEPALWGYRQRVFRLGNADRGGRDHNHGNLRHDGRLRGRQSGECGYR
jgi:hypothetical protein